MTVAFYPAYLKIDFTFSLTQVQFSAAAVQITVRFIIASRLHSNTCCKILEKTDILTYLLTYLLTYSMEQSPSEANRFSAIQKKIPEFYGTRRFITAFTRARQME